jgi:CheY-like chemotaxis protein
VLGLTMAGTEGPAAGFAVANVLSKPIRTGEVVAAMARLPLPADRRACVAVVDDDPLARDLMQATLRAIGIEAVGFSSGQAALAALAQLRPDAMVLDLMMPGFDGFAVLDALHQLPAGGAPPVLIWTSLVLSDDEYALLARSAQAIVSKGGGALTAMLAQLHRECSRASQALSDEAGL